MEHDNMRHSEAVSHTPSIVLSTNQGTASPGTDLPGTNEGTVSSPGLSYVGMRSNMQDGGF